MIGNHQEQSAFRSIHVAGTNGKGSVVASGPKKAYDLVQPYLATFGRGVAYVADEHVLFSVEAMARLNGVPRYGDAAQAAGLDPAYERNIEALKKELGNMR